MTIRQYKKKYFICKDDFGKMIYLGDTVFYILKLLFIISTHSSNLSLQFPPISTK